MVLGRIRLTPLPSIIIGCPAMARLGGYPENWRLPLSRLMKTIERVSTAMLPRFGTCLKRNFTLRKIGLQIGSR